MNFIILSSDTINTRQASKVRNALLEAGFSATIENHNGKAQAVLSGRLMPEDVRRAERAAWSVELYKYAVSTSSSGIWQKTTTIKEARKSLALAQRNGLDAEIIKL